MASMKEFFGAHHGLDERSMESLLTALERENLPGFDYLEFKQALSRLQEMDIEESVAFKSAFATASTMGLTKEKLLKTASHYKNVLAKEKSHFDDALQKQMTQRVEGKRKEVATLRKKVEEYRAKIKQLEAQIEKSEQTIASADQDIQAAQDSIEGVRAKFEHTLQALLNQIEKDIEDINTHL